MKNYLRLANIFLVLATLFVPASRAGVFCSLDVGGQPVDALHDAVNNRTFVSLFTGNEVYVLSHGCGIENIFGTGSNPGGLAFDGTNLWVALYGSNAVEKINVTTGAEAVYTVGVQPRAVAFDGTYIWVTNSGSNTVTKLLASNGFVEDTISVGSYPWGVAVDSINGQTNIWIANLHSASITVLNSQTNALVTTIPTGSEPLFFGSATTHYGTLYGGDMFVTCYTSQLLEEFSPQGALIASTAITGQGQPVAISQGPVVYGATHNARLFLENGGAVTYETVGDNNYGVAYDFNSSTVWITDINQGIIFEFVP